jgi:hypothetical protein
MHQPTTTATDMSGNPSWTEPVWWAGLREGAACFDAGRYWHAHEHWEREWRAHGELHRHYVKGLIQIAAACHHVARGAVAPARKLLEQGSHHLLVNRPLCWPFDTGHLLTVAAVMLKTLDQGKRPRIPVLHLQRMMQAWSEEQQALRPA